MQGLRSTVVIGKEINYWDDVAQENDTILLSLANFLRPGVNVELEAAQLLKSGSKHIVLAGAGAQADTYHEFFWFTDSLKRFLSLILD